MPQKTKIEFLPQIYSKLTKNQFAPLEAAFYEKKPQFSFTHYQHNHNRYSAKHITDYKDFHTMFERLKSMSQLKWKDIIKANHTYHCHPIDWSKTPEKNGFKLTPTELNEAPPWQFKSFKECRIVGFFNKNSIFELVWIDRDHSVYPRR